MKYFYFIIISFLFFSCVDLQKSSQLASIEKMVKSLDSMQIVLNEHPIDVIQEQKKIYSQLEAKIRINIDVSDTINLELGKKLDAIKTMREKFLPLTIAFDQLNLNISKEKKNLINLKLDITNSNGERGEYQKNLDFEMKNFSGLKSELENYTTTRKEVITIFNQNKIEFEKFANALENN